VTNKDVVIMCENWQKEPTLAEFAEVVRVGSSVLHCERALAAKFEVAQSTIDQWGKGFLNPHPTIQAQVIKHLEELARAHDQNG
jgi:hypothetical protein